MELLELGSEVGLRVHPVLIPQDKMIAKVDGVMNGISVVGDKVGETMFYGAELVETLQHQQLLQTS